MRLSSDEARTGPRTGSALPLGARPEPVALGPEGRLRAIGHADLAEDPRQVRLHRLLGDLEAPRDQLVRQPLEQQPEDLALARGQLLERIGLRARGENRARGAGVERRLAARGGADALGDLVGLDVLEQIARRARLERAHYARAV